MAKDLPRYTLRISSQLLEKLHYVAEFNGRSANKEIERLIKQHVRNFENKHGEIETSVPDDNKEA